MEYKEKIIAITALSADYCRTLESCYDYEPDDFIRKMLNLLPRLYLAFNDVECQESASLSEEDEYFESYVDEDFYESVRHKVGLLMGPDDTFLETFEENMKYSDTPIAASISECLADIFQPLYNFISIVKDTEGEKLEAAYRDCRENFVGYWSQTLCNVMRALNSLRKN